MEQETWLKAHIMEAIEVEKAGLKVQRVFKLDGKALRIRKTILFTDMEGSTRVAYGALVGRAVAAPAPRAEPQHQQ